MRMMLLLLRDRDGESRLMCGDWWGRLLFGFEKGIVSLVLVGGLGGPGRFVVENPILRRVVMVVKEQQEQEEI